MYSIQIWLKDKGHYKPFCGIKYTADGHAVDTARDHWRKQMLPLWPDDEFAIYSKDVRVGGKWVMVEELK